MVHDLWLEPWGNKYLRYLLGKKENKERLIEEEYVVEILKCIMAWWPLQNRKGSIFIGK